MSDAIVAALLAGRQRKRDPFEMQRRLGLGALQQGMSTAPVMSWGEGLARALTGAVGGYFAGDADRRADERGFNTIGVQADLLAAKPEEFQAKVAALQGRKDIDFDMLAPVMGQMLADKQKQFKAGDSATRFAANYAMPPTAPQGLPQGGAGPAIAKIESGGRYDALGPVANAQGDRAHGKYQVMGANIGPWTKEILGREMTPQEFLADPQAQEAVFSAKWNQYRQQFGSDEAAARAWFAGPGGMNNPNAQDVNGVTVAQYSQKFQQGMPAQGDAAGGNPPPGTVPYDVSRPQPSPELVERYRRAIESGSLTPAQAEIEMNRELDREWQVQRETRRMIWQSQQEDERTKRRTGADLVGKRMEVFEKELRPQATAAVSEVGAIHQVRQLLDAGAFTGMGAGAKAWGSRAAEAIGKAFGLDWSSDAQANTAALQSAMAQRVLPLVKNLGAGTGISNADREYAEKAAGGNIEVGEKAMRRILDIGERAARATIKRYGEETDRMLRVPNIGDQFGRDYFALPEAPTYEQWSKANPLAAPDVTVQAAPQAAQAPPTSLAVPQRPGVQFAPHPNPNAPTNAPQQQPDAAPDGATAVNPQTGQRLVKRNGQWVPVQ